MRINKVSRNIVRLALATIIGLVLAGSFSTPVKAQTNPVDLELDSAGATPWVISNIIPGDSGSKAVTLSNVGSGDGFVTIWLSDIISNEGLNPEAETGDTAEPGEADMHLQLNLTAEELDTNLDLPAIINDLPQSATWPDYIELIPLKAGETIDLQWDWELPYQTGNEAQGDSVSFTINYLLREFEITDVSAVVTEEGVFTEEVTIVAEPSLLIEPENIEVKITIEEDITGLTEEGEPVSEIWIIDIEKEPEALLGDTAIITDHYDCGPEGITFDEPITLTITYDPDSIPPRADAEDLVIVLWDENTEEWVELSDCIIDTVNNTISTLITHFSRYTVRAPVPPPPQPTRKGGVVLPTPPPEEEVTLRTLLEVDMPGKTDNVEIGADQLLREPLILTDRTGDFIIDIDSGSWIRGSGNVGLSRIELRITERSIVVPDDVVVLSSIYELLGYTGSGRITRINFTPSATLTMKYDLKSLSENTSLPFIANYIEEQGLVPLQTPPDVAVAIGEVKALISHASLFVVVAQVLPPPPPLPARFELSDLTINPQQVQAGEIVTISLTVTNEGATTGSTELYLIIDGIVRIVKSVTLDAKNSETLTFEVPNLAVGNHQVKIAGLSERFTVERVDTPPVGERVDWLLIDIIVGGVLVSGALVLYMIMRRKRWEQPS